MNTKSVHPFPIHQLNGHQDIFGALHNHSDNAFDDFSRDLHLTSSLLYPESCPPDLSLRADMNEDDKASTINLKPPSVDEKSTEITQADDLLPIKEEKKLVTEIENGKYRFVERRYGSFARSIKLPQGVEVDKVKTNCDNGVLMITRPNQVGLLQIIGKFTVKV